MTVATIMSVNYGLIKATELARKQPDSEPAVVAVLMSGTWLQTTYTKMVDF